MTYQLQYKQHGQPHWQTVNKDDDETPRVFANKLATSRFLVERGYQDFDYRAVKAKGDAAMSDQKQRRHLPPVGSVWGEQHNPFSWWIVLEHDRRSAIMARWGDHNTERVSGVQFWQMVKHHEYLCINIGQAD